MGKVYSVEEAIKSLGKDIDDFSKQVQDQAKEQVKALAAQTHSMILEKAQNQLHSTRDTYVSALNVEKISSTEREEIWAVTLDKSAEWIEDGQPKRNMIDDLVSGPKAKTSKEGHKYVVVPFQHNKKSSEMSLAQQKLANYVKSELKRMRLDKVIKENGKPVLGRVETVDLTGKHAPHSKQGKPLLAGLTIYQREVKTSTGKSRIKRDVMTFRVASEKQKGKNLWEHPGTSPKSFFEQVSKEIDVIWEKMIKEIVESA